MSVLDGTPSLTNGSRCYGKSHEEIRVIAPCAVRVPFGITISVAIPRGMRTSISNQPPVCLHLAAM